ncbi:recombinase family protein [Limosilactobacillus fermentum]|uniref:recombinase family protein n=1 Tax=Limosilactobacillus fermentum TaxID=1613 RepID=UPI001EDE937E|nr:recombinase family protein [Limosilactobacillus fermentum]
MGRKTSDVISFLDKCSNENITVNVLNMGRLDNSPGGRLMRNVISSFAEYERDMIVSRTQEGKAYAKQHNPHYREGRPKRRITDRYQAIYEYSLKHSIKETALATGVSESTVKRIRRQINH